MYSELPLEQHLQDEDLVEQFADYTILDLRSSLLKLIQTNIVYSYCESQIIEQLDYSEAEIAEILDCCQGKDRALLHTLLPFEVLLNLKKARNEVKQGDWNRKQIVGLILNLVVENTLLYSSLARFAYS